MSKIIKFLLGSFAIVIVLMIIVFINWEYIFGDSRPIANAKAIYQLEFKDKDIAETSDVDNKILYVVPKGDLDTYIKMMRKSGYKLSEKDLEHNTLTFKKGNNFTAVSYKRFARKYTIIESPFLKEV
ncbi:MULTISPECIES: hypothetical protein [Priestia]|uniref:hypothetical protein n=1 Tax=Priestia TaxID=2800373 RepID=UPI0018A307AE|nr:MULTISPECIES: hypothetical protein [Priestia]QTL51942.1 hypothetical protein J5Z55_13000 [Priestia aryabhattai]